MKRVGVRAGVTSQKTFIEYGEERLSALCEAAGTPSLIEEVSPLLTRMLLPWGRRQIGVRSPYRSNIADDEAPFEFAIAFSQGPPEVQFYVEALGEPPTLESNMHAGRALLESAASAVGACLHRLRLVEKLFFPHDPHGPFTIWTGVSCMPGRSIQLKAYLNPQVRGEEAAIRVVDEAMDLLGFAAPWAKVRELLSSSADRRDEIAIVSMDLSDAADARVKVYIRHHGATIADMHGFARTAAEYYPDDVAPFYATLACSEGPFLRKPPLTELAFTALHQEGPASATLEFPIGSYVDNDQIARERIARCMLTFGLNAERYEAAIEAFATRPLADRPGIHAHVTLRRLHGRPRIGIYLASEAYPRRGERLE